MSEWRDVTIPEFRELYKVSSDGDVYSVKKQKTLNPKRTKAGYLRVTLCNSGYQKSFAVHRLVALAFIPNDKNKPTVNHKNENKGDNKVENLEWATNREQNVYGTRIERVKAHTNYKNREIDYAAVAAKHNYMRGYMCNRKRTAVLKNGVVCAFASTQKEAAAYANVSVSQVSQCSSGKKKSCKGYGFRTIEEFPIAVTKIRFKE